jgi:hypothetical protein
MAGRASLARTVRVLLYFLFSLGLHVTRHDRIEHGEQRWQTVGLAVGAFS